jgi:hypothetical protein
MLQVMGLYILVVITNSDWSYCNSSGVAVHPVVLQLLLKISCSLRGNMILAAWWSLQTDGNVFSQKAGYGLIPADVQYTFSSLILHFGLSGVFYISKMAKMRFQRLHGAF